MQPVIQISDDYGGRVIEYVERVEHWRQEGDRVEIRGACTSACTFVLGLPKDMICVGPHAVLGFHRASGAWGTANLLHAYSARVKGWLDEQGGLTDQVIWATGDVPQTLVRRCQT